jgi:hypothetical protein
VQVTNFTQYACTWGAEPPPVQEIVDVARRAEDLGFHSLQIPHVPVLPYPEERPPRNGIAGVIPDRYQYDALVRLPMLTGDQPHPHRLQRRGDAVPSSLRVGQVSRLAGRSDGGTCDRGLRPWLRAAARQGAVSRKRITDRGAEVLTTGLERRLFRC